MAERLIIGGITMPALKKEGLNISKEKIWSSNTGRAADGGMIGDLVAIKYTLECEWPALSRAEVAAIDSAISSAFFSVTFTDPGSNSRTTRTFYAGTPVYSVYSYIDGVRTYSGTKVTLIEQ
jgi:hypothetical protein